MIFISYSQSDFKEVLPFVEYLRRNQLKFWLDNSNVPMGESFIISISKALWDAGSFLLIDTLESRNSYWVSKETLTAARHFKEGRLLNMVRTYTDGFENDISFPWTASFPLKEKYYPEIVAFLKQKGETELQRTYDQLFFHRYSTDIKDFSSYWFGRSNDLKPLDDWWNQNLRGLWISGPPRTGKKDLVRVWLAAHIFLGPVEASTPVLFIHMWDPYYDIMASFNYNQEVSDYSRGIIVIIATSVDVWMESSISDILHLIRKGARVIVISKATMSLSLEKCFLHYQVNPLFNEVFDHLIEQGAIRIMDKEKKYFDEGQPGLFSKFVRNATETGIPDPDIPKSIEFIKREVFYHYKYLLHTIKSLSPHGRQLVFHLADADHPQLSDSDMKPPLLTDEQFENALKELLKLNLIIVAMQNKGAISMSLNIRIIVQDIKEYQFIV